jgi:hypothetical protein
MIEERVRHATALVEQFGGGIYTSWLYDPEPNQHSKNQKTFMENFAYLNDSAASQSPGNCRREFR